MDELAQNPEPPLQPSSEPSAFPAAPEHGIRWIFIGQSGIRAGWGIALFILTLVASALCIRMVVHLFLHPAHIPDNAPMSPLLGMLSEGDQLLVIVVATGVLALIERKSLFAYGFQGTHRAIRFFSGLIWGFIAISALIFVLFKTGFLAFDGQSLHGLSILQYAAEWGAVFLLVGLCEESLLRGYVQYTFTRGVGFWWGALLFSVAFGFGHHSNPGESPVGLFAAGAIGLVFCLSVWYTGSLWWAVGFHAAWDWGESYFYGTRDSGLIAQGHLLVNILSASCSLAADSLALKAVCIPFRSFSSWPCAWLSGGGAASSRHSPARDGAPHGAASLRSSTQKSMAI